MEPLEAADFPELPCLGGCGRQVRAVELYGSVFPQFCGECRAEADAADEARERAAEVDRIMGLVRLGPKIRAWSLMTYPAGDSAGAAALREGHRWLHGYRMGERRNLVIYGPVGSGKTGLAWSLARDLIERDLVAASAVVFRELLDELRDSFRERLRGESPDLLPRRAPLLLLDDLGAERPTDFALEELASLVEHRWQRDLPTIVTSNYLPRELAKRLGHDDQVVGERILSRLLEKADEIRVGGGDRRT